jgi:hypothetical protein
MKTAKRKTYATVSELEKNFDREAGWADSGYGPNVPRLTKPGRPKKGSKIERTEPHSVRVTGLVWRSLQKKAKAKGLSTNAALQLAATEWISKEP